MNQQQQPNPFENDFKTAMNYAQLAVRLFSMTAEVFLRHSFGERYFNLFSMCGSCVLLGVASQFPGQQLMPFFFVAFLVMCVVHRIAIFKRGRQGVRWHSRYAGTSYGFWQALPFRQHTIQLYFEPALILGVGFLVFNISARGDALGLWLMFSGICLAASGQMDAFRVRSQILDVIDNQIESEHLNASVVEMKDPSRTEGFSVPVSLNQYTPAQRVSFADAMRRIDPTLRNIMSDTAPETKTPSAADLIREMEEEKLRRDVSESKIREFEQRLRQWR